jgi:serine/threonine protein kinase
MPTQANLTHGGAQPPRPSAMSFREGQQLGPYVIEGLLGTGGMAAVWRAWDRRRGQQVAIKVIADEMANDPAFNARFMDEVRRHARLKHPHIVAILDTLNMSGRACLVMDLVAGGSIGTLLDQSPQRRLPAAVAVPIILDVLAALDFAHRNGIWHRDVKPANILLDAAQKAYLSDFGISLALGEERRTRYGVPVGTAEYMSPEQIRTPQRVDHRTDVYSLGCVLYEMLTGRPPFIGAEVDGGNSDIAIRAAQVNSEPVAPRQRVPSIPADIDALIMHALSKNPDERLPGCAEFSRRLVAAMEGNPLDRASARPNPSPLQLLAISSLLVAALVALWYMTNK